MEVLVLSGNNCMKCNTLKKLLDVGGVEYEEVGLMSPEGMNLAGKLGLKSIPQVLVDGEPLQRREYQEVLGVSLD